MTTASLASLSGFGAGEDVDIRRFRPNVLIDTGDAEGLPEVEWAGRRLRIGAARDRGQNNNGALLRPVPQTARPGAQRRSRPRP